MPLVLLLAQLYTDYINMEILRKVISNTHTWEENWCIFSRVLLLKLGKLERDQEQILSMSLWSVL